MAGRKSPVTKEIRPRVAKITPSDQFSVKYK
jgi:hypothetical protein